MENQLYVFGSGFNIGAPLYRNFADAVEYVEKLITLNRSNILKPTNKCTAKKFRTAWCSVWNEADKNKALSDQFSGDGTWTEWTETMLKSEDAFLICVAGKLGLTWSHQGGVGNVDIVFKKKTKDGGYPHIFDVMVEHENHYDVENEMWKLMFLRCPLKVIIFYHHHSFRSTSSKWGVISLEEKLDELRDMLHRSNAIFGENTDTEYLFIIGSVEAKGDKMKWHWASDKQTELHTLC